MSKMFNPPHPGEIVKDTLITNASLSVTKAAELLGVTRGSMSKLINCRGGLSPEMALRLSISLNTSVEMWLNLQTNYDLWMVEKKRNKLTKEVSKLKKIQNNH